jgi:hypothetical protein
MKKRIIFAVFIALFIFRLDAQNYSVALIPDSLKENAHCVIRDFTKEWEIQSINSSVERIKYAITILDKEGDRNAHLFFPYNKSSVVNIKQILLYDANGKLVKKVKQSEIQDSPAYTEYTLYYDYRLKSYSPDFPGYPYTISYDSEQKSNNSINYDCWRPIDDYDLSLQHAQLSFIYPGHINTNIKEINYSGERYKSNINELVVNKWVLNNIKAVKEEPFDISITERVPAVYLMSKDIKYGNYEGTLNSWEDYGIWESKLYAGRDELPEALKIKIDALLKNVTDTLERIKTLYTYMQENTRYVAVIIGIGGLQPFPAKTVFETGYGDCKALSNYMHSMLKYIGIKSYPTSISAGRYIKPIFKDFPNIDQFNHVILCIPQTNDTLWLECTNQNIPFGFVGDFIDDRDVLILTENGGEIVHTKKNSAKENVRICNAFLTIDSTANAMGSIKTNYHGLQYDNIVELIYSNMKDQKEWLLKNSSLPSLQITDFTVANNKKIDPVATVSEKIISRNYATFTGNYMLVPLNLINNQKAIPKMLKSRYSDILIHRSFTDYDTVVYEIPGNYKLETIPQGKIIHSDYGEYLSTVSAADDNKIVYTRKFLINQGRYKPSAYKEFYEFLLNVSKADNVKAILVKTN